MIRRFSISLLLAIPLSLTAWVWGQDNTVPHQLLWKISGNGLKKPSWLYGTIHVRDPRAFELSDSAIAALESCDFFAMELHPDTVVGEILSPSHTRQPTLESQSRLVITDFREVLEEAELQQLEAKLQAETGMNLSQVDPDRPELYRHLLSPEPLKRGGRSTFLDAWLFHSAKLLDKPVTGLERLEEQRPVINRPRDVGAEWRELIQPFDPGKQAASFDRLLDWYRAGNLEEIWRWTRDQWTEEDEQIMARRNATMMKRAEPMMREGSTFIAVGVSHLPGELGLVQNMRNKGYSVEPVTDSFAAGNKDWQAPWRELPWISFNQPEQGYSLDWPVQPSVFVKEAIVEMFFAPDVGTGNTYYAGWIRLPVIPDPDDEETFMGTLINFLSGEGKANEITYRKNIEEKGFKGREMGLRNSNGQFFRSRFFLRENYIYLLLAGPGEARAQSRDADRFFTHFHLKNPVPKSWQTLSPSNEGFSVYMPPGTQALTQTIYSPEEGWTLKMNVLSGGDPETGVTYTFRSNIFPPDLRPESDEDFFDSNLDVLVERMNAELLERKMTTWQKLPAMEFEMLTLDTDQRLVGRYYLRGSKAYLALITAPAEIEVDPEPFFDSVDLKGSEGMKGGIYELSDFGVKIWFPDLPRINTDEYEYSEPKNDPWSSKGTFFAQDSITGVTWYYNRENYNRYAWMGDSTEFVRQWTNVLLGPGDRLLSQETRKQNGFLTLDLRIQSENSHQIFRRKIFLRGPEIHSLSAWLPPGEDTGLAADRFFNSLEFLAPYISFDLFEDKRPQILKELTSPFPMEYEPPSEMLPNITFDRTHLPEIHRLLSQPLPDDAEEWGIREKLIQSLTSVADTSSIPVLLDQLAQREKFQLAPYAILEALARMKTAPAANALKQVLRQQPPDLEYDASGYALMLTLTDSMALYADGMNWLPQLARHPDYELGTYILIDHALTRGTFKRKELEPHLLQFLGRGQELLKYEKAGLVLEESNWEPAFYLKMLISLLSHTGYLPEVGVFLREVQQATDPVLQLQSYVVLVEQGYAPDPAYTRRLAAYPRTRLPVWRLLEKRGKTDQFPSKYRKQEAFAESLILEDIELLTDQTVDRIQTMGNRVLELKGQKGRGYLFKYQLEGETEWKVAFSGLQPLNKSEVRDVGHFNQLFTGSPEEQSTDDFFRLLQQ